MPVPNWQKTCINHESCFISISKFGKGWEKEVKFYHNDYISTVGHFRSGKISIIQLNETYKYKRATSTQWTIGNKFQILPVEVNTMFAFRSIISGNNTVISIFCVLIVNIQENICIDLDHNSCDMFLKPTLPKT